MSGRRSLGRSYFEAIYQRDRDPWKFETSTYEDDKYRATLAALPRQTYVDAIEIGCSIGVFTSRLAPRCVSLDAVDLSPTAIAAAKTLCASLDNVHLHVGAAPRSLPKGPYDLIVLSEVLYYLDEADLLEMARWCSRKAKQNADIVLCHWLGETDYPLAGAVASDLFVEAMQPRLESHLILHDEVYRLERIRLCSEEAQ